jgi:hypothetical protein
MNRLIFHRRIQATQMGLVSPPRRPDRLVVFQQVDAMKILLEGDKDQTICSRDGITTVTYARRDVPFSDGRGIVKGIVVGICDVCKDVIVIPPQSTPAIRAARGMPPV